MDKYFKYCTTCHRNMKVFDVNVPLDAASDEGATSANKDPQLIRHTFATVSAPLTLFSKTIVHWPYVVCHPGPTLEPIAILFLYVHWF